MDTKRILTGMAVLLAGSAMVQGAAAREVLSPTAVRSQAVQAQFIKAEDLTFGKAADLRRVECHAQKISADVCDQGPFNDTRFLVAVVGSGGGIEGKAQAKVSTPGGCSGLVSVSRAAGNGNLRGYILYTEVNAPGFEKYDSLVFCTNADGSTENPTTYQLILDQ